MTSFLSTLQHMSTDDLKSLNPADLVKKVAKQKEAKHKGGGGEHEVSRGRAKATIEALNKQAEVMAEVNRAQWAFHEALDSLNGGFEFIGDAFRAEGQNAILKAYTWLTNVRGPKLVKATEAREAATAIADALDADIVDERKIEKAVLDGEKLVAKCMKAELDFKTEIKSLNAEIYKYVNRKSASAIVDPKIKASDPGYEKYKKQLKGIKLVQKAGEKLVEWGAEAADVYGFGWAVEWVGFVVVDVGGHNAQEAVRRHAKDHWEKGHTPDDVLEILDDDVLLIPESFIKKQKEQVELFLKAISPAMGVLLPKIWDNVNTAIETALKTYLNQRLDLVKAGFKEKPTTAEGRALWKQHQEDLRAKVKKVFVEEVDAEQLAKAAWKYGRRKPADWIEAGIKLLVKEAMLGLMAYFPPDPAQSVSGTELTAKLMDLVDTEFGAGGDIQDLTETRAEGVPTTTKGGNPVTGSEPSQTKNGRFWVTVDHPTYGRLRGYLDPDGTFEPHEAAKSTIDDWSNRTVNMVEGYFREDGRETYGTWYRPWPDASYYLFVTRDDRHLWADGFAKTRSGMNLAQQLTDKMESMPDFQWFEAL